MKQDGMGNEWGGRRMMRRQLTRRGERWRGRQSRRIKRRRSGSVSQRRRSPKPPLLRRLLLKLLPIAPHTPYTCS